MRKILRDHSLSLAMFGLFVLFLVGHSVAGYYNYNDDQHAHQQSCSAIRRISPVVISGPPSLKTGRANFCKWPPMLSSPCFYFSGARRNPKTRMRWTRWTRTPATINTIRRHRDRCAGEG